MRFKKLRILVGISMALFILIFGNILVFGLISGKDSSANKVINKELSVTSIDKTPILQIISQNSNEDKSGSEEKKTVEPSVNFRSGSTIRHIRRRSRAS